jgi:DNA-binding Lrp family transcriptional regulator
MERFMHNILGVFLHQEEHVAYILINVESGKDLDVFNRIRGLQREYPLGEIAMLYGDYDLIVKVRITKTDDLENFVFKGLRSISGITETKTLIAPRLLEFK